MISSSPYSVMTSPSSLVPDEVLGRLRDAYASRIPRAGDLEPRLRGVLEQVGCGHGSLVRAQLAYATLSGADLPEPVAIEVAIAVEYFHTASLLLDDLPCMDDARDRRGSLCPHVVHGEAATILGALGFINQAYAMLWRAMERCPSARRVQAADVLDACLGVHGILDGQSRDVHFQARGAHPDAIRRIADGKTGTLIRLCLVFPALLGGADDTTADLLSQVATAWGRAYQLLDDFKDCLLTTEQQGKTSARDACMNRPNLVLQLGLAPAMGELRHTLAQADQLLEGLDRHSGSIPALDAMQDRLRGQADALADALPAELSRRP